MMLGEMLCMAVFILYRYTVGKQSEEQKATAENLGKPSFFLFLPPALCDVTATTMMYIGLTMTSAAQFQMLRSSIMIFVGLLTVTVLRRRLEWFRWAGMGVVVAGVCMVGSADFLVQDSSGLSEAAVGDIIIVCAQVIAACQFVYEENYVKKYDLNPLQVVGSEGIFGFITLFILQTIFYLIPPIKNFSLGNNPDEKLEDPTDAFTQMNNEPQLYAFMLLIILSIAFFNFAGVSITKYMSATTRKVLDTLRTLVIWGCTMLFSVFSDNWVMPRMKDQFPLQVCGFFLLVVGIFLYSDVLIMPAIRRRREKAKGTIDA